MVNKVKVQEVVFRGSNSRSDLGRVVVNPAERRVPLKLHCAGGDIRFCCGKAFLTEEAWEEHQSKKVEGGEEEEEGHGPPINLFDVRMALHGRDNPEFWRVKKTSPAKYYNEDGDELEVDEIEGEEDNGGGSGDEEGYVELERTQEEEDEDEEDVEPPPRPVPRRRGKSTRKRSGKNRGYLTCEECRLSIPATNIRRHMRVCHNPSNEYQCRYCTCRFEVAYGRMVHEVKNHRATYPNTAVGTTTTAVKASKVRAAAVRVKKRIIPARPAKKSEESGGYTSAVFEAKHLVPTLSEDQMADYNANIRRVAKSQGEGKAKYQCLICNKTFFGLRNAQDHMNSHNGRKPFKCPLCEQYFSFRSNVVRHIKTCHTENSDFVCPYGCGCSMQSESSLKVHINLICTLRHLYQSHNNKVAFQSSSTAAQPKPRPRSIVQSLSKTIPPPPSLKARPSVDTPTYQYNSSNNNFEYAADETASSSPFMGSGKLKQQYQHLEVSPGIFRCEHCHKTITGSGNFRDHINVHLKVKPHKCTLCYMRFTFKSNIRRHLRSAHVPNGQFKCPMNCGCSMDNSHALQSHLNKCKIEFVKHRRSLQQKPQNAAPLAKALPQLHSNNRLQTQPMRKMATGTLPRPPPLTPRPNMTAAEQYNTHFQPPALVPSPQGQDEENDFDGGGKFQCNVCGKSVSCRRNLNNHMLIHLNLKPVKCFICGLFFRTMDTLKKHRVKSHGPNSPYGCPLCPCKFSHMQGLNMHTNIHHNNKQVEDQDQEYFEQEGFEEDYGDNFDGEEMMEQNQLDGEEEMMMEQDQMDGDDDVDMMNDDEHTATVGIYGNTDTGITPKVDLDKARTKEGYWKCPLCGKILKKGLHLQNHMRIHSGEKPYVCKMCGARFRLASTLYDHKKSSHRGGKWKCHLCTCAFETNLGLSRHKGIFHNTQAHDYLQRKVRFIREKAVKSVMHFNSMTQDKKPFISTKRFLHPSLHASKTVGTAVSSSTSFLKKEINSKPVETDIKPCITKSGEAKFQCGHCEMLLPSLNALSEHQLKHQMKQESSSPAAKSVASPVTAEAITLPIDPNAPAPRNCPICNQSIHGRTHYSKHMSGCHSGGNYRCEHCPCSFDSQGNISRHYTLMHPGIRKGSPGPIVNEPISEIPLASATNNMAQEDAEEITGAEMEEMNQMQVQLTDAMLVSGPGKLYVCKECGKTFDKMNRFKLHITMHSNIKPYQCRYCDQRFRLPGILNTHVKKSHGSGSFRCSLCPSRFTSAKGLSVHQFVFHKGGRAEREGIRNIPSVAQNTSTAPIKRQNNFLQITKVYSPSAASAVSKQTFPMASSSGLNSKPVKLKCHICANVFFGTNALQAHMKQHSKQQNFGNSSKQLQFQQHRPSNGAVATWEQEQEQEDCGEGEEQFEILGYDNVQGYATAGAVEGEQEYDDGNEDFDYMNADDHLEIVHEDTSFNNYEQDEGEEGGNGVEVQMSESNGQNDSVEEEEEYMDCKGCHRRFESRDAFAFHVENDATGSCPYCCTPNVTVDSLPSHIEDFHPLDEIEYLESHIYSNS